MLNHDLLAILFTAESPLPETVLLKVMEDRWERPGRKMFTRYTMLALAGSVTEFMDGDFWAIFPMDDAKFWA